jgi:demethylmenaquinone methyltransferase / 2-methoxy-6-polyprenyl-1,4-benzoquinol methylase
MAESYYQPGRERAGKVNDLFGTIAPRYDLINDLQSLGLHRGWKRRLVRLAGVGPGRRALDLCCGTGDVAFGLAGTGAEVVGLDFSERMIEVATARLQKQSHAGGTAADPVRVAKDFSSSSGKVEFRVGDALRVPFPSDTFDAVTIAYGLRNLADWEAGLGEMWRVARPGGRLLVLDFGKPDNAVWRALYFGYLRWIVPLFGRLLCGDAALYRYILESLRQYPAQHGVAAKMRQIGCEGVNIVPLLGGVMSINYGLKR